MDVEDEYDTQLTVDNVSMLRLKQFYDRDVDIQICREKKKVETFRHDYTISWWYKDERELLPRLPYQNEPIYKKALQDILWLAQDYLTLFKFVGFYIVKDMDKWVADGGKKPPFGVLEIGLSKYDTQGEFVLLKKKASFEKEIMYRCYDEQLIEKYHFFVFNCGAMFVPLSDKHEDIVVPQSPFSELIEDRDEIIEARICVSDANFQATHPEGFLFSKPLPETAPENVPEEILYAMDDLESAKMATSQQRVTQAVTLAEGYCERIRSDVRQHLPRVVREKYGTLYQERRAEFMRPTLKESLEPLPSSLEVSRGPPPTFLIKPEELMRRYEDKICSLLNFPHLFFKAQTSMTQQSGKNVAGGHQLDFSQRQLEDSVIQQQALFEQLYQDLYTRSFIYLDMPIFSKLPEDAMPMLEHLRVRVVYNNLIAKSDEAIFGLLPLYKEGIITGNEVKSMLVRNFGFSEQAQRNESPRSDAQRNEVNK
jgi:hypothetical protein